jgi:hypothetical protein
MDDDLALKTLKAKVKASLPLLTPSLLGEVSVLELRHV